MSFAKRSAGSGSGVRVDSTEANKRLNQIQSGLGAKGLSAIGKATVKLLNHDVRAAIQSTTSPAGVPWRVRQMNPGWAPLQHTGDLRGSIDPTYKNFGATLLVQGAVKSGSRGDGKRFGLVAGVQQFGRPQGSKYGRMPARRFMGLSKRSYSSLWKLATRLMGKG